MSEWRRNTTDEKWLEVMDDLNEAEASVQAELAVGRGDIPDDPNELSEVEFARLASLLGIPMLADAPEDTLVDDGYG